MSKQVNLQDLVSIENPDIQTEYIRTICDFNSEKNIKIKELQTLQSLLNVLSLERKELEGFFYSYEIPQLGKEFDLLKIMEGSVLNIEIKSEIRSQEVIFRQLLKNQQYFGIFNGKKYLFGFVQNTGKFFRLVENNIIEVRAEDLKVIISEFADSEAVDIDDLFAPNKFLVSPLNTPEKFLNHEYFLTEQQQDFKTKIVQDVSRGGKFFGLTGRPGTGKTLLLYDIAVELSHDFKVGVVHCGLLNSGHAFLNEHCQNLDIVGAKELRLREIKGWDVVLVDETHRIYPAQFDKVVKWITKTKAFSVLSFDETQILSKSEDYRKISEQIRELSGEKGTFTLSKKIRTNIELASFISCLFNRGKVNPNIQYKNVHLYYAKTVDEAIKIQQHLTERKGYRYIAYTPSVIYNANPKIHDQLNNPHRVIGQEFDKVVMIMGDIFFYEKNLLKSRSHPNPDYLYEKLLYQGLTRVRNELSIIIYNNEVLMAQVLSILKNTPAKTE